MRVEALEKELDRLEKFIGSKEFYDKQEILDWVAECVAMFSSLGIDGNVINSFIETFSFQDSVAGRDNIHVRKIGPFQSNFEMDIQTLAATRGQNWNKYKLENWVLIKTKDFFHVNIAFATARRIIEEKEAEERLVPKALVTVLSENESYSHIVSSLELVERAFEERNADGVLKNSITLLESTLNLEPELSVIGKLSDKLNKIYGDEDILKKFGVYKEFITALNNSRIIRNIKSSHKALPIPYDIPFLVAVGCAYLVLTFLEITMATGELII